MHEKGSEGTMLDQTAVGLSYRQRFHYTWRDVVLYNLSVGAGPEELSYVYEQGLKAVPTFGVVPCTATFGAEPYSALPTMPTAQIQGLRTDGTLHMDHTLRLYQPMAVHGTLDIEKVITHVYDRGPGKGAKITVDIHGRNEAGELCFTNTMGYLNRWGSGCGGEKPEEGGRRIPEGAPDLTAEGHFPPITPLLYRLTGDTYPIHADPALAKESGLPGPIVHGLCSLGHACRILIAQLFPGEPERMKLLSTQFRNIVLPGDSYALQIWRTGAQSALFRMINPKDGKPILEQGLIQWGES